MSDPVKPEETQQPVVVEPSAAPKTDEVAPVVETTSEPAVTTTATTTGDEVTPVVEKPAGEAVAEEKKEGGELEPQEITKGTLSKLHSGQGALSGLRGGLLSFFKRERFFYFSEEALSEEKLKTYLHRDNASAANAAYATQTGKGLLFYSKQEGHVPHGIIKLADVTEILPIGPTKFDLKLSTGDLHFESPTNRDSWVFTLRHKVAEARAAEEEITNSDGYKAALEKLSTVPKKTSFPILKAASLVLTFSAAAKSTAVVAGRAPAEVKGKEEEKGTEEAEKAKKAEAPAADNDAGPSSAVKRSASKGKKKVSALRDLLSKKEKKEEPVEKKEGVSEESKVGEPTTAATTTTTNAPPATDASEEAKDIKPSQEAGAPVEPTAGPSKKRQSIFNSLIFKKEKETEEKKEKEPEAVVKTEPETEAKPIDTPAAPGSTEKTERTSTSSPPKPKFSSFFGGRKVEKEPEAKPEEVKPAETTTQPVPVPGAATDAATPAEGASATDAPGPATSPKERRLSSFFPFKKEKKADDVKSDSEEAEPSSPKPSTSPANFVVGLYRRASKAGRSSPKETEAKEVVAPATVPEETPAVTTAAETEIPNGTDGAAEPTAPTEHATAIGDVVAEAVNVGPSPPVQLEAAA